MVEQTAVSKQDKAEIERLAARRAGERAKDARWDLNIAIFLFAVLIIVIILLFQGISIEVVSPIALFGLAMVWLVGWRQGKRLYVTFYQEERARIERDLAKGQKPTETKTETTIEETIEERVQKALRERYRRPE